MEVEIPHTLPRRQEVEGWFRGLVAVQGGNNGEAVSGTITAVRTVGYLPTKYGSQGILDTIHKFCFSRVGGDGSVGGGREWTRREGEACDSEA